MKRINSQL